VNHAARVLGRFDPRCVQAAVGLPLPRPPKNGRTVATCPPVDNPVLTLLGNDLDALGGKCYLLAVGLFNHLASADKYSWGSSVGELRSHVPNCSSIRPPTGKPRLESGLLWRLLDLHAGSPFAQRFLRHAHTLFRTPRRLHVQGAGAIKGSQAD